MFIRPSDEYKSNNNNNNNNNNNGDDQNFVSCIKNKKICEDVIV